MSSSAAAGFTLPTIAAETAITPTERNRPSWREHSCMRMVSTPVQSSTVVRQTRGTRIDRVSARWSLLSAAVRPNLPPTLSGCNWLGI